MLSFTELHPEIRPLFEEIFAVNENEVNDTLFRWIIWMRLVANHSVIKTIRWIVLHEAVSEPSTLSEFEANMSRNTRPGRQNSTPKPFIVLLIVQIARARETTSFTPRFTLVTGLAVGYVKNSRNRF